MSMASAQRIVEILEEKPDITNPENPVMEVKNGEIEFLLMSGDLTRNAEYAAHKEQSTQ